MRMVYVALASTCVACGLYSGDEDLTVEGDHVQYVVSELRIPANSVQAHDSALDLDGDKAVDNQLGQIFGTLAGQGLGVGGTAQESLLRGGLIMLADLQTTSFETTGVTGVSAVRTFLGADPTPSPCTDPDDLATCGQHLEGTGAFSVVPGSASDLAVGAIEESTFNAAVGTMPVEIVVDQLPLRLDLRHARIRLTGISETRISAILAGAITTEDVDGVVIPEATAQIARIVTTECHQPQGIPPCGCIDGERAKLLQALFDANDNCEVTVTEVHDNTLVQSLLAPDVRFGDERLLSFGVSVDLVRATFAAPP